MIRNRWYGLILVIVLVIALIIDDDLSEPYNDLVSWMLLGIWCCYVIMFLDRVKYTAEYKSPHNTIFFIWGSLLMSTVIIAWGDYTTVMAELVWSNSILYLNLWILLLGIPVMLYAVYIMHKCYKKFFTVYISTTLVDARKFAIFTSIVHISNCLFIILGERNIIPFLDTLFVVFNLSSASNYSLNNFVIWLFGSISFLFFITYGIFGHRPSISRISSDAVQDRVSSMNNSIQSARNRERESDRQRDRENEARRQRERDNETRHQRERDNEARRKSERENEVRRQRDRENEAKRQRERAIQHPISIRRPTTQASANTKPKPTSSSSSSLSESQLQKLRPKAGTLSEDDFKCVFCFKLPKLPEDKNRGIIICPQCKHPAHADEYRNWLKNSTLCSRCDGEIASRYRINPEVINTKIYLDAARILLKRK